MALGLAIALPAALAASASPETSPAPAQNIVEYQKTVLPLLEKHCYECHGDGYDKGKVAFDPPRNSRTDPESGTVAPGFE